MTTPAIPTKPYVVKLQCDKSVQSVQSWHPQAVCAIAEINEGGEVACYPGFEQDLAAEVARRHGFVDLGDGRWRYDPHLEQGEKQYILTDGDEIFDRKWLTAEEFADFNKRAIDATDGNLYWLLEEECESITLIGDANAKR